MFIINIYILVCNDPNKSAVNIVLPTNWKPKLVMPKFVVEWKNYANVNINKLKEVKVDPTLLRPYKIVDGLSWKVHFNNIIKSPPILSTHKYFMEFAVTFNRGFYLYLRFIYIFFFFFFQIRFI
jgi:hypothetical protein